MAGDKDQKPNKNRYLRYVKAWEKHPALKNWIAPTPGDEYGVFCRACQRRLYPHKKDLLKHALTQKHLLNAAKTDHILMSAKPSKDQVLASSILEPNGPTIKCEKMEYSFNDEMSRSLENKPEDRSVTIEVFPASSEREEADFDGFTQSMTEEISTGSLMAHNLKDESDFNGWLDTDGGKCYCTVCDKELKPRKVDILKHAGMKSHQFQCLQKGIRCNVKRKTTKDDESTGLMLEPLFTVERVIDIRSDSVTQPSPEMKNAMMSAKLCDTVFIEDENIQELETKLATLFEKETALMFPSGSMANLVAVMTHCWSRDSEVFLGDQSQILEVSAGGLSRLCAIATRTLKNLPDGTFDLNEFKTKVSTSDSRWPITTLVCIENSHCNVGGRALPVQWLEELYALCEDQYIIHLDGGRLLNAAVACGRTPSELVKNCDSVTFCFDKGLGCPFGSVLIASNDFIERARRIRDMLGGSMHQSGIFAAAAIYSLENVVPKLSEDHRSARVIAQAVHECHSRAVTVDMESVETNIVILTTDNVRVTAKSFCDRMATVQDDELAAMGGDKITILMKPLDERRIIFMTHLDINKSDLYSIVKKIQFVIRNYGVLRT